MNLTVAGRNFDITDAIKNYLNKNKIVVVKVSATWCTPCQKIKSLVNACHEEIAKEIPEIDRIFGSNDHKQIMSFLTGKEFAKDDPLFFRSLMTPNHYAYIKIAEGCDNGCSFCSIPLMRGLQKSRTISSIKDEAER